MKTILYLIVFTLLIALLYFFSTDKPVIVMDSKPINKVSLQTVTPHPTLSKEPKKAKTAKETGNEVEEEDQIDSEKDSQKETDDELDYITAYRDWQYFQNCYTDVEDFHNDKDPLQTLAERFAKNPRESQTEPTPQQNMYYQSHVDICKTLIDDEQNNYYQVMEKLEKTFRKIIPETKAEKQLAHSLRMVEQLKRYKLDYSKAHYNKSNLAPEELKNLNSQMEQLTQLVMEIYDGNDTLTPEHTELIKQYSDEVDAIRLIITSSKQTDTKLIAQIAAQIDGFLNSMDDYLHRIQSPDAFLVIAEHLYKSEYFQKDSTVLARLKAKTGINDTYYIEILNQITMPLIACSMDYPCDAQSDYILSYCLGLKDSMFNQACGQSLENFYFNFYIGANQLNDVNNYFSYMVNRYAN